jgi:hypothetical protein
MEEQKMANKKFLSGILALVLVFIFGLVLAGCPTEDDGGGGSGGNPFVGTWRYSVTSATITFRADLTLTYIGQSGKYTYTGKTADILITGNPTHMSAVIDDNGNLSFGGGTFTKQ